MIEYDNELKKSKKYYLDDKYGINPKFRDDTERANMIKRSRLFQIQDNLKFIVKIFISIVIAVFVTNAVYKEVSYVDLDAVILKLEIIFLIISLLTFFLVFKISLNWLFIFSTTLFASFLLLDLTLDLRSNDLISFVFVVLGLYVVLGSRNIDKRHYLKWRDDD